MRTRQNSTLHSKWFSYWALHFYGGLGGAIISTLVWAGAVSVTRPIYEAVIVVGPTQSSTRLQLPQLGGGAGSLLSALTGNLGHSGTADDFTIFRTLLTSQSVVSSALKQPNLAKRMIGARWNDASKSIIPSKTFAATIKNNIFSALGIDFKITTTEELTQYVTNIVEIAPLSTTGLYQISARHPDPQVAKDILLSLYHADDGALRAARITQYENYSEYLKSKIGQISSDAVRKSLIETEQQQEVQSVLANADVPYAAELSSGPTLSIGPVVPRPITWLFIAWGFGVILGIACARMLAKKTSPHSAALNSALQPLD